MDSKDYEKYKNENWHVDQKGYVYRYKRITLHRAIMNPNKNMVIDHINGDKLDNRKNNLRVCSQKENMKNQKLSIKNKTGFKGVYFRNDGRRLKYTAQLKTNGKAYVKSFITAIEAARYYNKLAKQYFGKYAQLNQIEGDNYGR